MPWKALGRGYNAILAQHYPATALSSPTQWKTLSTKGPKLSARIRKNISAGWSNVGARVEARRGWVGGGGMLTYVVIHPMLARWRLRRWEGGGPVREKPERDSSASD